MLKKFIFCLSILALHLNLLSNALPNREMIILLDTSNSETIEQTFEAPNIYRYPQIVHPVGMGAISASVLIALYQQAAPIIISKSLIKNIIDHKNLFDDFVNLDRKSLFEKYGKFNRFRGRLTLDNFRENCLRTNNLTSEVNKMLSNLIKDDTTNFDQILNQIANHPKLQGYLDPNVRNVMSNDLHIISVRLEMQSLYLCSLINFDKDWDIKQVNDDIFLLIPKNYIKGLGINFSQATTMSTSNTFTNLELELGLKIDHMKNIKHNFFNEHIKENRAKASFSKSLEQIFLTIDDIEKIKSTIAPKHVWSFHLSGHGKPQELQLNVLPQLHELKKLYQSKLRSLKTVNLEKNISKHLQNQNRIQNYNQKYINKLKKLDHEIEKFESRKKLNNLYDQPKINSLLINEFRDTLKFFNTKIETAFLYYFSCFSAGPHLIEPYQENGKPLILRYPIMTGTLAENESLQQFPYINIPPYFSEKDEKIVQPLYARHINIDHKKLCMTTPLRFDIFFKLLRKGIYNDPKNLILLPYSLHPHVDEFGKLNPDRIANIPLIRFAYSDHFKPMPVDNSSIILNSQNSTKPLTIDKAAGLVYSDYIPRKVVLNKLKEDNEIPKLISMKPGFALHVFEHIQSASLNIKEIVNSFLTFPELGASKIFWIKKLECISNNGTRKYQDHYKDIIILRNIFNSNTLDLCSDLDPLTLENCAYFSNNNQESKLTWKGPFIDDFNSKIVPSQQISHKEECLNCFPNAKSYVNPILQSI